MSSRARYPPPGMGGGRGGGGGMNPNAGPNPSFQPRNPMHQYVQRGPAPNNQNQQMYQNHQQQQWLRRNQLPPSDSAVDEVEKTVQSEAIHSRWLSLICTFNLHILPYVSYWLKSPCSYRLISFFSSCFWWCILKYIFGYSEFVFYISFYCYIFNRISDCKILPVIFLLGVG